VALGNVELQLYAGVDSVVVRYDAPPPPGGDYGPVFMADNMIVTAADTTPEPETLVTVLAGPGLFGLAVRRFKTEPHSCPASAS